MTSVIEPGTNRSSLDFEIFEIIRHAFGNQSGVRVTEVSRGARNRVYQVALGHSNCAIVKFFLGQDAQCRAATEVDAYAILARSGLPVPEVYHSDLTCSSIAYPYVVESKLPGEELETVIDSLQESDLVDIVMQLASLVARTASISLPFFGDLPLGSSARFRDWGSYLLFRAERALRRCVQKGLIDLDFADRYLLDLRAESECQNMFCREPTLTHGDLVPKNVQVALSASGWRIVGIFDCEYASSACGDWDFVQMQRTLFYRFPGIVEVFFQRYKSKYGLPADLEDRQRLYGRIEAVDFWSWGADYIGLQDEVRSSIANVRKYLRPTA